MQLHETSLIYIWSRCSVSCAAKSVNEAFGGIITTFGEGVKHTAKVRGDKRLKFVELTSISVGDLLIKYRTDANNCRLIIYWGDAPSFSKTRRAVLPRKFAFSQNSVHLRRQIQKIRLNSPKCSTRARNTAPSLSTSCSHESVACNASKRDKKFGQGF